MSSIRRICLHGAAHGVWKEMIASVCGGREDMCAWKSESDEISITEDILGGDKGVYALKMLHWL